MRRVAAHFAEGTAARLYRVASAEDMHRDAQASLSLISLANGHPEGLSNISGLDKSPPWVHSELLQLGDVIHADPATSRATVLFRESDVHHGLLLTNRCNSYCLMCSQPPTPQDDSWLIEEAVQIARHIRRSPVSIGLSGGEPLLLGPGLGRILEAFTTNHPTTHLEVLTNGRLLADPAVADVVLPYATPKVRWLVPLYAHADFLHDFVVQSHDAFDQTIAGLLRLQEHGQRIQLRIVLIRPVLEILSDLCLFIARNLPFVQEVALMACEPIGFALANRELCEVDLADWTSTLLEGAAVLRRHRVRYLFMNAPLCALPPALRPFAHKSISDWKNVYAKECEGCAVREACSGLFAWHEKGWKPTTIQAIRHEVPA